jgi:hypothetical protein
MVEEAMSVCFDSHHRHVKTARDGNAACATRSSDQEHFLGAAKHSRGRLCTILLNPEIKLFGKLIAKI